MGTAVVVLVAIPYIVVFKSLTSSEEENKYEQAHRWFADLNINSQLSDSQIYWPWICSSCRAKNLLIHEELSIEVILHPSPPATATV